MRTGGTIFGAMEKSEMSEKSKQKPHTIKVHNVGDFFRKEVILQIRLQGKWLLDAGLRPDTKVQVTNPQPGVLIVKSLE